MWFSWSWEDKSHITVLNLNKLDNHNLLVAFFFFLNSIFNLTRQLKLSNIHINYLPWLIQLFFWNWEKNTFDNPIILFIIYKLIPHPMRNSNTIEPQSILFLHGVIWVKTRVNCNIHSKLLLKLRFTPIIIYLFFSNSVVARRERIRTLMSWTHEEVSTSWVTKFLTYIFYNLNLSNPSLNIDTPNSR